jgi:hypothetical protein
MHHAVHQGAEGAKQFLYSFHCPTPWSSPLPGTVEENATGHVSVLCRLNAITHHTPLIEVCNLNAINFSFKV